MLLHLAGQVDRDALELAVDLDGVVDRRQLVFGELGVEGRTDDLGDLADVFAAVSCGHEIVSVGFVVQCREAG